MWTNPRETADLFTFTEEILNEKLPIFVQWNIGMKWEARVVYALPNDVNKLRTKFL